MCALLALLVAPVVVSSAGLADQFSDPYSSYYVEREVRDTAAWIQGLMRRALLEQRDFVLELYSSSPNPSIRARWTNPSEVVERRSDRIAYRVNTGGLFGGLKQHHYSHRYQTMSPAFEIAVYAQTPEHGVMKQTKWGIVVSLYGFVRLSF